MSISVGGLISGLDTNSMIEQLMELQQKPILKLQQQEAAYQVELSAYGSLQGILGSLKSAVEDLDSVSNLTRFSASSGDPDLFSVSADENATSGSYDITVQQLSGVHKLTSGAFSKGEYMGEGTIHLKVGNGSTTDIAVSATDTIVDVAQAINDSEAGVRAGVIFDGTDYFLTLAADETGVENVINLVVTDTGDANNTDMNGLSRLVYDLGVTENLSNTQNAADSIITVDGVADIHRGTNVITDVIEGVTITLESAPAASDNQTTLTVSRDMDAIVSKITAFVDVYNEAIDLFEEYQSYDSATETAGVLLGDATAKSMCNRLNTMVTGTVSGVEAFSRLVDLGITLNTEGRLEVDSSTLNSALDDHFDDVLQFFTQSTEGSEGFAVRMKDTLDAILKSTDGTLAARSDGIQNSIKDIEDQVERLEMRVLAWETRTRAQFNALELLLAEYQTTGNYLSQQIVGMQNLNNYISNRG
ncbi:MAG: flagellar filament capping protein FliD [Thermodesulfobacteriota bacterium]|nr:flagellar filament capping protein FliD [Thermodesulfobacteriota bacterium]